jgi:hypothetical protein
MNFKQHFKLYLLRQLFCPYYPKIKTILITSNSKIGLLLKKFDQTKNIFRKERDIQVD